MVSMDETLTDLYQDWEPDPVQTRMPDDRNLYVGWPSTSTFNNIGLAAKNSPMNTWVSYEKYSLLVDG